MPLSAHLHITAKTYSCTIKRGGAKPELVREAKEVKGQM